MQTFPLFAGVALDLHLRPDPEDGPHPPVAEVLRAMLRTPLASSLVELTLAPWCARASPWRGGGVQGRWQMPGMGGLRTGGSG